MSTMRIRTALLAAAFIALLPATSAHADIVCTYHPTTHALSIIIAGSGTVSHDATGTFTVAPSSVAGDGTQTCSGATDSSVAGVTVRPLDASDDSLSITDDGHHFAPGYGFELGGAAEVEWDVDLGSGHDTVMVTGDSQVHAGAAGINLNPQAEPGREDVDVTVAHVEGIQVIADHLADSRLDMTGGGGLGAPLQLNAVLVPGPGGVGLGGDGADMIVASGGDSVLAGGLGDDVLAGCSGDDVLAGGPAGGVDRDILEFLPWCVTGGVTVDLGSSEPQDLGGGAGRDTLSGFDGVQGTVNDDTFLAGARRIDVDGNAGHDTLSYATRPGPVHVDLVAGRGGHDGEQDVLYNLEEVVGSPAADQLWGSDAAETFRSDDGGAADGVRCLGGEDTAIADDADVLTDCEHVTRVHPAVPAGGDPGAPTGPAASTADAGLQPSIVVPPPPAPRVLCRVPRLTGLTLTVARRRLTRAHCALGTVRTSRDHLRGRTRTVVASQRIAPGRTRAQGTKVAVTLKRMRARVARR